MIAALRQLIEGFANRMRRGRPRNAEIPRRVVPSAAAKPLNAAVPPRTAASVSPTDGLPPRLGPYAIGRRLAHGAMGAVHLATDRDGREVAIKTMAIDVKQDGASRADARQRFFREAEAARRLQHPGIVAVLDVGEERGIGYIAMELLHGSDLRVHCRTETLLPVPRALAIAARIAQALAYAHTQGIVHRDVKPANVMVDLAADSVKITDFGIARLADASRRTQTGLLLGTPTYISPEQLLGQPIDGRADLYSLGVLLFELLTGRLPFEADAMSRLMQLIVNQPAPDVRTLRPELPDALTPLLQRALEKQPAARFADGLELANALQRVIESSASAGA